MNDYDSRNFAVNTKDVAAAWIVLVLAGLGFVIVSL